MTFAKVLNVISTTLILSIVYFIICPWIAIPKKFIRQKKYFPSWNSFRDVLAQEKNYFYQF